MRKKSSARATKGASAADPAASRCAAPRRARHSRSGPAAGIARPRAARCRRRPGHGPPAQPQDAAGRYSPPCVQRLRPRLQRRPAAVDQRDPQPRPPRRQGEGEGQPGRPGADHADIRLQHRTRGACPEILDHAGPAPRARSCAMGPASAASWPGMAALARIFAASVEENSTAPCGLAVSAAPRHSPAKRPAPAAGRTPPRPTTPPLARHPPAAPRSPARAPNG